MSCSPSDSALLSDLPESLGDPFPFGPEDEGVVGDPPLTVVEPGVASVGVSASSAAPRPKRLNSRKGAGKAPPLPKRVVSNIIVHTPALKKGLRGLSSIYGQEKKKRVIYDNDLGNDSNVGDNNDLNNGDNNDLDNGCNNNCLSNNGLSVNNVSGGTAAVGVVGAADSASEGGSSTSLCWRRTSSCPRSRGCGRIGVPKSLRSNHCRSGGTRGSPASRGFAFVSERLAPGRSLRRATCSAAWPITCKRGSTGATSRRLRPCTVCWGG